MAHWDLDRVGQWLIENGFGKYSQRFRDEDIDGSTLFELREKETFHLLTLIDSNGIQRIPSKEIQQRFRLKLEELKAPTAKQRRTNSRRVSINPIDQRSKILLIQSSDPKLKFFQSDFISSCLKEYLAEKFHIQLNIRSIVHPEMKEDFSIEFFGTNENLSNALQQIERLFSTIKCHIFDDEKIMNYSKRIQSVSILSTLEKIFFEKKKLTVWEKTKVLEGCFRVFYLDGDEQFQTSLEFLRQTLNNEILMIDDLILSNPSTISKKSQEEFEKFLQIKANQSTMTIISLRYPFQSEIQLIFFGLRSSVRLAKKQLRILLEKHRMKTVRLDLDLTQRQFLLDHCQTKLRKIEIDHQLSNVKISIRESSFVAPKFLIQSIRESISSMIFHSTTIDYQFHPNAFELTGEIRSQLKNFIESFHCESKEIEVKTKDQSLLVPRKSLSKFLQQESDRFFSSISRRKTISIASNTIEIQHESNETFDLEVISNVEDAAKEHIDSTETNAYFESRRGRRILFVRWSPPSTMNEQSNLSIETFFLSSLNEIVENCPATVKTIRYVTNGWEKSPCRGEFLFPLMKLLAERTFVNRSWRIFFICGENFNDFLQISPDSTYEEFLYPISTLTITLEGKTMKQIDRCEKKLKEFIEENFLRIARLHRPFDGDQWNQSMIDVFYQFCLKQNVLPRWTGDVELIGTIKTIEKVKEKYRWILRRNQLQLSSIPKKQKIRNRFNLLLSCSSHDEQNSKQLADRLIEENFLVSIDFSDQKNSSISSTFNRIDLILICFTWNYFIDANCQLTFESIKSSRKKFLPVVFSLSSGENLWLETMELEEAFYQRFEKEIRFRLNENFDLLLCELLRYTKPGVVGQTYPLEDLILNEQNEQTRDLQNDGNDNLLEDSQINKTPWWETGTILEPFDHSFDTKVETIFIGSWFNTDECHQYFEQSLDKDRLFREKHGQIQQNSGSYLQFNTYIKKGTVAWDFQYNRVWIKEYRRRLKQIPRLKYRDDESELWLRLLEKNSQLFADWKDGKISLQSNFFRGKIGDERKSRAELLQLEQIDQPTNQRWQILLKRSAKISKQGNSEQRKHQEYFAKFLQNKIENILQWNLFCKQKK